MFEQTFIKVDANGKKPYTLLFSLLLQVAALAALIMAPLIYTQVLPQAKLRSVFAAPTPPAPPTGSPKPPMSVRSNAFSRSAPRFVILTPNVPMPSRSADPVIESPPDLSAGNVQADLYSTGPSSSIQTKPPEPAAPIAKPAATKRLRLASMEPSQLIHKVQPEYPQIARQIRVQGTVEFTAVISKSGTIENLQLVHGHPMLVKAATDAILQWRYKPTLLNGEPVEVVTNIIVNFTLNEQ